MSDSKQVLGIMIIIGAFLFLIIGLSSVGNNAEITMQNSSGIIGGFAMLLTFGIFLMFK